MGTRASRAVNAGRARPARTRPTVKKRIKTALALLTLTVLSLFAVAFIYFLMIFVQESKKLPSLAEIGNFKPSEGTKIFYADGPVMAVFATENRRPIKLADMGKNLVAATIATEDSRFYEHSGVDMHGVARAIFRNVVNRDATGQGASTITQQLARNISELGIGREKKLRRKVAEAILAMRIEQTFTKDEILELYLNQIYYGNGAYGCEAAALTYFHKRAKNLSLGEAALLAGLPQRPAYYSSDQDAAYKRRDWVLQRMEETGKITAAERQKTVESKLKLYKADPNGTRINGAPYFVNYVMQQLVAEYGADAVYSGWRIYTTVDSRIQKAAEESLRNGVHKYGTSANQGALISLDPKTGYIRAMVGGLNFKADKYNIVTQGIRQPGSAFKPIVYTALFDTETGTLDSTYRDDPNIEGQHGPKRWQPKNYGNKYTYGSMRVRTALQHSVNTIAVKAAIDTGIPTVIEYAHRLGISTPIEPYAPIALGAAGVHPIELCSAYGVFANEGKRALPLGILRVVDAKGEPLQVNGVHVEDTHLKPETLSQINEGLELVVQHGTGTAVASVPNARGKTGTTSDNRDAWFAGYTPELVTVIWSGRENRKNGKLDRKQPYLEMPGATGGHLCAPIWRDFMLQAVPVQQAYNKTNAGRQTVESSIDLDSKDKRDAAKKRAEAAAKALQTANGTAPGNVVPAVATTSTVPGGPTESVATPAGTAPSGAAVGAPTATIGGAPAFPTTGPTVSTPTPPVFRRTNAEPPPLARSDSSRVLEPTGRLAAPPMPRNDPGDEMISVRLCADSGRRATQWCDTVVERRMRRKDVPRSCRTHHAPPGEGNG